MFGGISYMVQDKMCIGVSKDPLMVRIDPEVVEDAVLRKGPEHVSIKQEKIQEEGLDKSLH